MTIKIATWNINSIRMRVHQIHKIDVDIICIQEMKCQQFEVPTSQIEGMGFKHNYYRGEKSYNGVGIFSKIPLTDIEKLDFGGNEQARHISAVLPNGTRIHNFYVPAGGEEPDYNANSKFSHKLRYLDDVTEYFANEKPNSSHILMGDLNVAPFENDVWSHKQLLNVVSHTPIEIEKMDKMYKTLDWTDAARHFIPMSEKCFSWWSYRNRDWRLSNRGRRLDHFWVTPDLKDSLKSHEVMQSARDLEKPSDHAPVIVELEMEL